MFAEIKDKFQKAVQRETLLFNPPDDILINEHAGGVETATSLVSSLRKKPTKNDNSKTKQESPWSPPEEDLFVSDYKDDYMVILNKYAVSENHFLLVTKEFVRQEAPLTPKDWMAALELLRMVDKESRSKHIGFFNCGPNSGASIPHKHIQFMRLPEGFEPFPESTPNLTGSSEVMADRRLPFCHFLASIPPDVNEDIIAQIYSALLGQILTRCAADGYPLSYNLVFGKKWILATPRSKESSNCGISINALGTVGILLAQNQNQAEQIAVQGLSLITEVGFRYEEVPEFSAEASDHIQYF